MNRTVNIKKIPLAFGNSTIELDIPERNISSVILPSGFTGTRLQKNPENWLERKSMKKFAAFSTIPVDADILE